MFYWDASIHWTTPAIATGLLINIFGQVSVLVYFQLFDTYLDTYLILYPFPFNLRLHAA